MTTQQKRLLLVGALLLAHAQHASADTIVTVPSNVNSGVSSGSPFTFSFAPITAATELLSISAGTFSGGEGGTISVAVDYTNSTTDQLFSQSESTFFTVNLASVLQDLSFPQGTIDGLTFGITTFGSGVDLPQGTTIDFAQAAPAPEPGSLPVLGVALAGLAMTRRRKSAN
jgi:hypothetical protein